MFGVKPGTGCIPAPPGTMADIFVNGIRGIGLEVPGARPAAVSEIGLNSWYVLYPPPRFTAENPACRRVRVAR